MDTLTKGGGLRYQGIGGEVVPAYRLVYMANDGRWYQADADAAATLPTLALTTEPLSIGQRGMILFEGIVQNRAWTWTVGGEIYTSGTAGALTQVAPATSQQVAVAIATDIIYFDPQVIGGAGIGGVTIRQNSGADVGTRPRLNLIDGVNMALAAVDDAVGNEVDIIFNAAAAADTRGFTIVVAASNSLDPTLAPVAYRCDGVADEVEINAAIVAMAAVGGSVILLDGTYVLAASIVTAGSLYLLGSGPATIINAGVAAHAIDINNDQYVELGFFVVQTTSGGVTAFNPINIRGGSSDIYIHNIRIAQSDNDGIAITQNDDLVHIHDVYMTEIDRYPINCDGDDCSIHDCEIAGSVGNDGIWLGPNSEGCWVLDNKIHSWTGEPIDDDGNNTVKRNLCALLNSSVVAWNSKGCGFDNIQDCIDHQAGDGVIEIEPYVATGAAIFISLDAVDDNLKIVGAGMGAVILTCQNGNVIDINACSNIEISGLTVITTVNVNDAIEVRGASHNIQLHHMACTASTRDAITIAAAASEVHINHCNLYGASPSDITRYGLNLAGDDNIITGNRIHNTGDDGVWIQLGATNNIVSLNRISNWTGEAIDIDDLNNEVVHNILV